MVGRRRVLLDDEDAGGDAADGELLVALDFDGLDLQALDERVDVLALRVEAAVVRAHPAEHAQLARPREERVGVGRDAADGS